MHARIDVGLTVSIDDDKTQPLATFAEFITTDLPSNQPSFYKKRFGDTRVSNPGSDSSANSRSKHPSKILKPR